MKLLRTLGNYSLGLIVIRIFLFVGTGWAYLEMDGRAYKSPDTEMVISILACVLVYLVGVCLKEIHNMVCYDKVESEIELLEREIDKCEEDLYHLDKVIEEILKKENNEKAG